MEIAQSICLNMIVRNEGEIISQTLELLTKKIKISYYVICDTGSNDDTVEKITSFFQKIGIKGEIYFHEWKDFGHNRSLALECSKGKCDYTLIFDADDYIEGKIDLTRLISDSYLLTFGNEHHSYQRKILVKSCFDWRFVGILHECINCKQENLTESALQGDYFVVSGRTSSRNKNPNKYLDDAKLLENGFTESLISGDDLHSRYAYYCANSYSDAGCNEKAIEWYKKTLEQTGWCDEKYNSCLRLFELLTDNSRFYYLVESHKYNQERVEGIYELVKYYSCQKNYKIAWNYYLLIQDYYENRYLSDNVSRFLFARTTNYSFFLAYYMIIICTYTKQISTGKVMYLLIFEKEYFPGNWWMDNLFWNLRFFIKEIDNSFTVKLTEYIKIMEQKYNYIFDRKCMVDYGLINNRLKPEETENKILIYTGFMNTLWNSTYINSNAIGGAEKAVYYLSKYLPKSFEIIISGDVKTETIGNIKYINRSELNIKKTRFHTIIVSRYLSFFELFPEYTCANLIVMAHDIQLYNHLHGSTKTVEELISKNGIDHCVCLTNWHKNLFLKQYPLLKDKIKVINNGIDPGKFPCQTTKIKNSFIYSSCVERGLKRLIKLWPEILNVLPDATLNICSYNAFPDSEHELKTVINGFKSIKNHGKLIEQDLYNLMSKTEYWLYPTDFSETSCITSLEMLMNGVICLYYPIAGLVDTLGDYGIPIEEGQEINTILNLTEFYKQTIIKRGRVYAESCSWNNRAKEWCSLLDLNEPVIKIINLKRRPDRKKDITQKLDMQDIKSFEFFEAVDGAELSKTNELIDLFKNNNFNYHRGVIGCALSHLNIWKKLLNSSSDYYVILEDDITFCDNFNEKLNKIIDLFLKHKLEHLVIGGYNIEHQNENNKLCFIKNSYFDNNGRQIQFKSEGTFGYIIHKTGAAKIIDYINKNGIKYAIDDPNIFIKHTDTYLLNEYIVHSYIFNKLDSDIQTNNDYLDLSITVAFCDWWRTEYCGGLFNETDNFFTNLLKNFHKIKIVQPNQEPDILFYSIFGENFKTFSAKRKIFYSGEPFPARPDADYNLSFDPDSYTNSRIPLWLCYLNDYTLSRVSKVDIPTKTHFCSFISSGENKPNNRKTFVEKLSRYKRVDCGGEFLNNVDLVPRGTNCSGKIEFNNKYRFSITFENEDYPGYVSEKILDAYKSDCIPIYWGTDKIVMDFNPNTFINCNDFENFDQVIEYIVKVDNDPVLYASYFQECIFSPFWKTLTDPTKTFFRNVNLKITNEYNVNLQIFNIWHNKLFDHCYESLDNQSLSKITMFDVNENYPKVYNKKYNVVREYQLPHYNSLYQSTNYCQASAFYHIFKNKLYTDYDYIGFIQYDMELQHDFIYSINETIKQKDTVYFYSLTNTINVENAILLLELYNNYFGRTYTVDSIKNKEIICLHTFVIPTSVYIKMMEFYCSILDQLHSMYINGRFNVSMSETTEILFGLFLLLETLNQEIHLEQLKLTHNWPNIHDETEFINYKNPINYFPLKLIAQNEITDKDTCHSYLDTYERVLKHKYLTAKNVLEIGVQRGGSIKLWNDYFVNAQIYGIDIDPPPEFLQSYPRIKCLQMDAYNLDSIKYFENVPFDLIIDDGPHTFESMVYFIEHYIPLLDFGGVLIVEDIPNISWCEKFKPLVPKGYIYEIVDLRPIKSRWDDILFIITKNEKNNIPFKIEYGTNEVKIDITQLVDDFIPANDQVRSLFYSDPAYGSLKKIFINEMIIDHNISCFIINNQIQLMNETINASHLTVYQCRYKKRRLGKDNDGGYIFCDIPCEYSILLSGGILDDISFEESFCELYPQTKCYAYDGFINGINIKNPNITFIKEYVYPYSLDDLINGYTDICVKMDIEGGEVPWILALSDSQLDRFSQIVIEFHNPFGPNELIMFNRLNKQHILVHFHANNCCGTRNHKGVNIPNVFECTYIHKRYYHGEYILNTEPIPGPLDQKNLLDKPEIIIDYPPFVN
jgi:GR25 family glycosyltransferase involved in LPS biosynthesis/glycosyltransferase involved in cell wall biosynthesis